MNSVTVMKAIPIESITRMIFMCKGLLERIMIRMTISSTNPNTKKVAIKNM